MTATRFAFKAEQGGSVALGQILKLRVEPREPTPILRGHACGQLPVLPGACRVP